MSQQINSFCSFLPELAPSGNPLLEKLIPAELVNKSPAILQIALNPEPANCSNQYRIVFIRCYDPLDAKFQQISRSECSIDNG